MVLGVRHLVCMMCVMAITIAADGAVTGDVVAGCLQEHWGD